MSLHEEEALGQAYDARLMRRLLTYLGPYRRAVGVALAAIIGHSALQLAQPYLTKLAIDSYIATGDLAGLDRLAVVFLGVLLGAFVLEYVRTYILQMTGQRIMFDLRMEVYAHLQKLDVRFFDRNPVGRLMTRVTTDVDVMNELFASGVVTIFGDVFMLIGIMAVLLSMDWRLALVAFSVLPLIVLVTQWFRRHVRDTYRTVRVWIARINAYLQEHITGMATVQLFRREARSFDEFGRINRTHRDANIASIFYYAVFYPAIESHERTRVVADHLVRRRLGSGSDSLTLGCAGRLPPVRAALLPPDQRHVGEVQRAAGRHGVVGTDFQAARYAGGDRQPGRRGAADGQRRRAHRVRTGVVRLRRRRLRAA